MPEKQPSISTLKPGIYTDYTLSPVFSKNKGRVIALIAKSQTPGQLLRVTSLSDAKRLFPISPSGVEDPMLSLLSAIYATASPVVLALGVEQGTPAEYRAALTRVMETEAYFIVCDSKHLEVFTAAVEPLTTQEKILIGSVPTVTTPTGKEPTQCAGSINSNRICLTAPAVCTRDGGNGDVSAGLFAALLSQTVDPAKNLIGESVGSAFYLPDPLDEQAVEAFLQYGITVFSQHGGRVELIRGMTTSTKDEHGTDDVTYRNVSMILIQDTVMMALRETLQQALTGARNNQAGLNTILSLLVCQLDDFVENGLLHSYDTPTVSLDPDESSRCVVGVGFGIIQGISIIHLTAHISV